MSATAIDSRFYQPLEPRLLLTCVIEQDAGTLRILGNDDVQIVELLDHGGGGVSVNCSDGAGAPEPVRFERVRLIQISTNGGADQINYHTDGAVEGAAGLQIDAGDGADAIALAAEFINGTHRWDVELGEGDDTFAAIAHGDGGSDLALALDTGDGANASNDGQQILFADGHSDWNLYGGTAAPGSHEWSLEGLNRADLSFDLRGDVAVAVNAVDVGSLHTSVQHGPGNSVGPTTILDYVGGQDIDLVPGGASSRTELQSVGGELAVAAHSTNASHELNLLATTQPGRPLVPDGQTTVIGGLINSAAQMDGAILVVSAADGPMPQSDFDATLAADADGLMLDVDASGLHSFATSARGVQLHDGHLRAVSGDAGPSTMSLDMERVVFTGAFDIDLLGGSAADRLFARFSDVVIARDSLLDVLIDGMAGDDVVLVTFRGRVDGIAAFTLLGGPGEDSVTGVFRVAPASAGGISWIILA